MLSAIDVASRLGYTESANWIAATEAEGPDAHLLRRAREAGVVGTYLFRTSPENYPLLPARPVIHVAQANTPVEARQIHKRLWNLGDAPFIIIVLPHQVRIYTGFRYERQKDRPLRTIPARALEQGAAALADFNAAQVDSGRIWHVWGRKLAANQRVDQQLLNDLNALGNELIKERGLKPQVAHSLIGKYIYIRYLREREILSDPWLHESGIDIDQVLGRNATLSAFRVLVDALEERFNGRVFPLPLDGADAPTDADVAFVAQVLLGDSPAGQMAFDFQIYDFSYIPVELLSSIYEQFLHAQGEGRKVGAYYTPEPLAEYLLSEINAAKPLRKGMKILDPCCGSGVFLVLAYRRLIEQELQRRSEGKLRPKEILALLTESIFGVERNPEACYVTEFSLLLMMLTYIDPPELHRNRLKFPTLHNRNIFQHDFFDPEGLVWKTENRYDWIVGNPPWVELDPRDRDECFAIRWIKDNARLCPVARYKTSEAFAWHVLDLLAHEGHTGLVVHATSLTNDQSRKYRKKFFSSVQVLKVTNFSNLAYVLFDKRAQAPAATLIYARKFIEGREESQLPTLHYGPFVVNQLPIRTQPAKRSWVITVYESEISTLSPSEVCRGDALTWKMALWGTYRDQKLVRRMRKLFPRTVKQVADERGCTIALGVQLREQMDSRTGEVQYSRELENSFFLDPERMSAAGERFLVPAHALVRNPDTYIRKRGGSKGLALIKAPHVVISPTYAAYSDQDFVLTHPRVGIAGPARESDFLRALSIYLNSNVAKYLAFFGSTSWGLDRSTFGLGDVEDIPMPELSSSQIDALAELHRQITRKREMFTLGSGEVEISMTSALIDILALPASVAYLADEFVNVKLATNKGKSRGIATEPATERDLTAYGHVLKEQLDSYAGVRHGITIRASGTFIVCEIEPGVDMENSHGVTVHTERDSNFQVLWDLIGYMHSQWVYVQRNLVVFDEDRLYLVKAGRRLDWTRMQALLDSDDVIAEVLSNTEMAADDAGVYR